MSRVCMSLAVGSLSAVLLAAAPARAEIHCTIAPTLAVTDVLGMPSAVTEMRGPAPDQDIPSATTTVCQYTGGTGSVWLTFVEFPSAQAARDAFWEEMVLPRFTEVDDPERHNLTLSKESGPGERAYSIITVRTAGYASLKGSRVVLIAASGPGLAPEDLAPKIKSLLTTVLGKL